MKDDSKKKFLIRKSKQKKEKSSSSELDFLDPMAFESKLETYNRELDIAKTGKSDLAKELQARHDAKKKKQSDLSPLQSTQNIGGKVDIFQDTMRGSAVAEFEQEKQAEAERQRQAQNKIKSKAKKEKEAATEELLLNKVKSDLPFDKVQQPQELSIDPKPSIIRHHSLSKDKDKNKLKNDSKDDILETIQEIDEPADKFENVMPHQITVKEFDYKVASTIPKARVPDENVKSKEAIEHAHDYFKTKDDFKSKTDTAFVHAGALDLSDDENFSKQTFDISEFEEGLKKKQVQQVEIFEIEQDDKTVNNAPSSFSRFVEELLGSPMLLFFFIIGFSAVFFAIFYMLFIYIL